MRRGDVASLHAGGLRSLARGRLRKNFNRRSFLPLLE